MSAANFIDLLMDAVCVVDAHGRFVSASAACERIFGYTPDELVGRPMIELVAPECRERTLEAANQVMSGQPLLNFENCYLHKSGRRVHVLWSARWSERDQVRIAVARDITERKQAEVKQAALYAISEAALEALDLLALFQRVHRIIDGLLPATHFIVAMHDAQTGQLGFPYYADSHPSAAPGADRVLGQLCSEIVMSRKPLLVSTSTQSVDAVAPGNLLTHWLGVPLEAQRGTFGALVLKIYGDDLRYSENDKELLQFVATQVATAVERKQMQARLQHMAQYDELTGLPNRGLLHDRLESALARARRDHGNMSVLYLDLDKFKQVNDTLGHSVGDLLLQQVAERLRGCVRESDTVARMSGDEFVVVLERVDPPECAASIADKIRAAISQPLAIEGHRLSIQPSIGIAVYPEDGATARQLLSHADAGMYAAKKAGTNQLILHRYRDAPSTSAQRSGQSD